MHWFFSSIVKPSRAGMWGWVRGVHHNSSGLIFSEGAKSQILIRSQGGLGFTNIHQDKGETLLLSIPLPKAAVLLHFLAQ